jgi:hypothetical protein
MEKSTDVIPMGMYCYSRDDDGTVNVCPYWDMKDDQPEQMNGYCHFLGEGDWDVEGLSLLWDQCKECGENWGDDEDLE